MAGLFDYGADEDERKQNLGLLGLLVGGNIMAANGPGVTTGQAIGTGLTAGAQGMFGLQAQRLRAQQLAQQKAMQDAQIGRLTSQTAQEKAKADALQRIFAGGGEGGKPNMADVAVLDPTAAVRMTLGLDTPASIKEWEHFNALPQEQKVEYLNMKRAQTWRDFGGYQAAPNPVNPSLPPVATVPNTLRPGEDPAVRGQQAAAATIGQETAGGARPLVSKAQQAVDDAFARQYAEFVAGGGSADAQKNITQLEAVLQSFQRPDGTVRDDLTGPLIGTIPKSLRDIVAPSSAIAQEKVEEVIQRNLRIVLGAQFTAEEGERLIKRAYNPAFSEEENIKRLTALSDSLKNAYRSKVDAAKYYEEKGTLQGFKGRLPTIRDLEDSLPEPTRSRSAPASKPNTTNDDDLVRKYLGGK